MAHRTAPATCAPLPSNVSFSYILIPLSMGALRFDDLTLARFLASGTLPALLC
jgi:hypothetical protein